MGVRDFVDMADEPSNAELAEQLAEMRDRLDAVLELLTQLEVRLSGLEPPPPMQRRE